MWLFENTRLAVFHDGNTEIDGDNSEESSTGPTLPELLHRAGMVQLQESEENERADSSDDDLWLTGSCVSQLWQLGIAGSLLDESPDDEPWLVELVTDLFRVHSDRTSRLLRFSGVSRVF